MDIFTSKCSVKDKDLIITTTYFAIKNLIFYMRISVTFKPSNNYILDSKTSYERDDSNIITTSEKDRDKGERGSGDRDKGEVIGSIKDTPTDMSKQEINNKQEEHETTGSIKTSHTTTYIYSTLSDAAAPGGESKQFKNGREKIVHLDCNNANMMGPIQSDNSSEKREEQVSADPIHYMILCNFLVLRS